MTLQLKLHEVTNLKGLNTKILVLVDGSQSGQLKSPQAQSNIWKPAFKILCSNTDTLNFFVFGSQKATDDDLIGTAKFNASIFVKKNKHLQLDQQIPYQLSIQHNQIETCTLNFKVKYDKAQKYQGQFPSARDLGLGRVKTKPVDFYKGPCPTKNIFSYFDQVPFERQFKAVESFYRDKAD